MLCGHPADDAFYDSLARGKQFIERDRCVRHSRETTRELARDVLAPDPQNLSHRAIMAEEINDKSTTQPVINALMSQ